MATARQKDENEPVDNEVSKPVDKEAAADLKAYQKATETVDESYEKGYHGSDANDNGHEGLPEDSQTFEEHSKAFAEHSKSSK